MQFLNFWAIKFGLWWIDYGTGRIMCCLTENYTGNLLGDAEGSFLEFQWFQTFMRELIFERLLFRKFCVVMVKRESISETGKLIYKYWPYFKRFRTGLK